jgi:hypothetical protein
MTDLVWRPADEGRDMHRVPTTRTAPPSPLRLVDWIDEPAYEIDPCGLALGDAVKLPLWVNGPISPLTLDKSLTFRRRATTLLGTNHSILV